MRIFPEPGSQIWANIVFPGMLIQTEAGEQIEVENVIDGYTTIRFDNGHGRAATVDHGDRVRLLGYFNPEDDDSE